jgi:hypothetical protein
MYRCANPACGETWPTDTPGPPECPKCGGKEHTATVGAHGAMRLGGSATARAEYALDASRLTVLALLLAVGLTAGLALGFGIGGWWGVGAGLVAGFGLPFALAMAFRANRSRKWLAKVADWAIGLPT